MYLPFPVAFRSLSRLSSALSAKASTLRSYCFYYFGFRSFQFYSPSKLVAFFYGLFSFLMFLTFLSSGLLSLSFDLDNFSDVLIIKI